MTASIAIVDVCSGNLRSVERAIERAGGRPIVTRDPDAVRRADKIVVPGQGAFGVFMQGLIARDLGAALREVIGAGRPYLGICLGLQILFDVSEESLEPAGPPVPGLGALRGRVVRLRPGTSPTGAPHLKVPHIGWNQVRRLRAEPLLAGVPDAAHVYFVHSYHAVPADRGLIALEAEHGVPITAAIRHDNLFACQFHPEKSQDVGIRILRNFVEAA